MPYDAAIFDNDGVLFEPTPRGPVENAIQKTLNRYGITNSSTDLTKTLYSVSPDELKAICAQYDIDPQEFWYDREQAAARAHLLAAERGEKNPYPDIDSLLELSVPLGIVSNSQQLTIDTLLDTSNLRDRFDVAYGRDPSLAGLSRKKPDTYYLQQALSDLSSTTPVFIGDSNTDLAAAEAIDIDSVFLRRSHRHHYVLEYSPTHEITSLAELPAVMNTST